MKDRGGSRIFRKRGTTESVIHERSERSVVTGWSLGGPGAKPLGGPGGRAPGSSWVFCILTRLNRPILGSSSLLCPAHFFVLIILKSKPDLEILQRKKSWSILFANIIIEKPLIISNRA